VLDGTKQLALLLPPSLPPSLFPALVLLALALPAPALPALVLLPLPLVIMSVSWAVAVDLMTPVKLIYGVVMIAI
jgi:hypothetical protein